MVAVVDGEVRPEVSREGDLSHCLALCVECIMTRERGRTGRRRSRSHQTAMLVIAGEGAKTRMGSQRTRHSQSDQR